MGIFDTYIDKKTGMSIQLKDMATQSDWHIGDGVLIDDGIYFAPEGMVIIHGGKFVAALPYESGKDKWGNDIYPKLNYFKENIVGQKDIFWNLHNGIKKGTSR